MVETENPCLLSLDGVLVGFRAMTTSGGANGVSAEEESSGL